MDHKTKQVVNCLWWAACLGGIGRWLYNWPCDAAFLPGFLFFCALQLWFFSKFYGRADSYAFISCAVYAHANGYSYTFCLLHMLLSLSLLTMVQLFRKNVNSRGNLYRPVAFIPYISIAFLCLFWYYGNR